MNRELLQRLKTAGAYQRKAVYALFPEEMNGHLEVIEKELKMMAAEAVMAFWKNKGSYADETEKQGDEGGNCGGRKGSCEQERSGGQKGNCEQKGKVRKVEITT